MLISSTISSIDLQAKLFRGFADPSRLSILEALREGERTVSDLVQTTGFTQPNVSNHLSLPPQPNPCPILASWEIQQDC